MPASLLDLPPGLVDRWAKNGFFDSKVRAFVRRRIHAQERVDAHRSPILLAALEGANRARLLADQLQASESLPGQFIDAYRSYADGVYEWIATEGSSAGEFKDAIVVMRAALRASERLLRDAQAGAFASQAEVDDAVVSRLVPRYQRLRDVQARISRSRERADRAFEELGRAEDDLRELLNAEGRPEREHIKALADSDPDGIFALMLQSGAR